MGDWWVNARCEAVWGQDPSLRCMRPEGHEGKHRVSRSVPETVWFRDEYALNPQQLPSGAAMQQGRN